MNDDNAKSDAELIQELNNSEAQADNTPIVDKIVQNNPFVKIGSATYQNVQTQSMIKTSREEAGEQLAAINARNAEILRQQQMQQNVTKVKKTGVYIVIGIIGVAILAAIIWLVVAAITASRQGIAPAEEEASEATVTYDEIDGYKCTSKRCEKVTNIDSTRFIVHDGSQFYIFDTQSSKKTNTAIPEREYHAITTFKWGGNTYAELDPESEKTAIYSITSNLLLTEFSYDEIFTDINNAVYNNMKWVEGKYIVAKTNSGYRLIDISNGKEMVRGGKRVFARESFYFGYESDGTIRAYTADGKSIVVIQKGDTALVRSNMLIHVSAESDQAQAYSSDGETAYEGKIVEEINLLYENVAKTLKADKRYFQIPVNN